MFNHLIGYNLAIVLETADPQSPPCTKNLSWPSLFISLTNIVAVALKSKPFQENYE